MKETKEYHENVISQLQRQIDETQDGIDERIQYKYDLENRLADAKDEYIMDLQRD